MLSKRSTYRVLLELGPDAGHDGTAISVGSTAPVVAAGTVGEAAMEGTGVYAAGRSLDDEFTNEPGVVGKAPGAVDEDVAAAGDAISEGMPGVEAAATDPAALEVSTAAVVDWSLWPATGMTAVIGSTTVELNRSVVAISETTVTKP